MIWPDCSEIVKSDIWGVMNIMVRLKTLASSEFNKGPSKRFE